MDKNKEYMQGTVVSEEYAAKSLGFNNVFEMRQWQTELGHKVKSLEFELQQVERDRDNFQWYLKRTNTLLYKIIESLKANSLNEEMKNKLISAIVPNSISNNINWSELKDWFPKTLEANEIRWFHYGFSTPETEIKEFMMAIKDKTGNQSGRVFVGRHNYSFIESNFENFSLDPRIKFPDGTYWLIIQNNQLARDEIRVFPDLLKR